MQLEEREAEVGVLKGARDEVMKESEDTRRKLEVLTQFFNKKEAELQKQLGLQSVRSIFSSSFMMTSLLFLASRILKFGFPDSDPPLLISINCGTRIGDDITIINVHLR